MYKRFSGGFTIVELIIVVTVIAILAAVSIVSYDGVRDRADDTAVKADLTKMAEHMNGWYGKRTNYPTTKTDVIDIESSGFSIHSYATDESAVLYCTSSSVVGNLNLTYQNMAIVAKSRTGNVFVISDEGSVREYTGTFPANPSTVCPEANSRLTSNIVSVWLHNPALTSTDAANYKDGWLRTIHSA